MTDRLFTPYYSDCTPREQRALLVVCNYCGANRGIPCFKRGKDAKGGARGGWHGHTPVPHPSRVIDSERG